MRPTYYSSIGKAINDSPTFSWGLILHLHESLLSLLSYCHLAVLAHPLAYWSSCTAHLRYLFSTKLTPPFVDDSWQEQQSRRSVGTSSQQLSYSDARFSPAATAGPVASPTFTHHRVPHGILVPSDVMVAGARYGDLVDRTVNSRLPSETCAIA